MQVLQSITLDFGRNTIPTTVFAKRYDSESRFVKITPLNNGQSYTLDDGITAALQIVKPDGKAVISDCAISDGIITAELSKQALAVNGIATAEIALYKDTAVLSSQTFYIEIKDSAYIAGVFESSNEYNALVEALGRVNTSIDTIDTAITNADNATKAANTAASGANTAKTAANNAASAANTAASGANSAKTAANNAAAAANTAAGNATSAAAAANSAAKAAAGAEKVNIAAEQTPTGADITVTDRTGAETTVHIDTLNAVSTWADIRNAVRMGLGATLFPVGYEFTTVDSDTGVSIVWTVRGHDHHTPANSRLAHSMTLEMKNVYSNASGSWKNLQYDASEALYYAADGLAAGTYHFTVANQAWYADDNGKVFQFTLTSAVPAGGQVCVSMTYNATLEGKGVKTYASPSSATVIETVTLTEGSEGTDLGTTNGAGNINHLHRIALGSNNYAQSAARQWLNSAAAVGGVWAPTNKFDRAPSWATTYNGFMHGLPSDFLEVVESAVIPCRTNGVCECASLDGTEFTVNQVYELTDKFFLLSRPEVYGTYDSTTYKDGELLDYYDGLTNAERKKYDEGGTVRSAWLRSPNPSVANVERIVNADGSVGGNSAYSSYGVAPACIIA